MSDSSRLPAVLAYLLPFIGWLYVLMYHRKNTAAMYHLKQAIGLFLFLLGMLVAWGIVAWLLAWIPLLAALGVGLFTLVMAAYFYGVVAWIMGLTNALRNRLSPLPGFGRWAERLPIR
jgi:uncharacterized membrane protein